MRDPNRLDSAEVSPFIFIQPRTVGMIKPRRC